MKTYLLKLVLLTTALGCGLLHPRQAAAQSVISYTGGTLTENFDGMGPTGTNAPPGWFVGYADPTNLTDIAVNDGSVAPNQTAAWNFGMSGAGDRALGTAATTTGGPPAPTRFLCARFRNDSGQSLSNITVSYDGEQYRTGSTTNTVTTLVLQYSVDGSNFVDMGAAFNFTQRTFTPLNSALDGNDPANRADVIPPDGGDPIPCILPGGTIFLRWFNPGGPGADAALAIDNFSFRATAAPVVSSYTITILPGQNLIANQLDRGANTLDEVLPSVPDGTQLFTWDEVNQTFREADGFIGGFGWFNASGRITTLGAYEAVFLHNPGAAYQLVFTGQLRENVPPPPPLEPERLSYRSAPVEAPSYYVDMTGEAPEEGTLFIRWNADTQSYATNTFTHGAWQLGEPVAAIGEGVLLKKGPSGACIAVLQTFLRLYSGANSSGSLLPGGAQDPQFKTAVPPFPAANPFVPGTIHSLWLPNGTASKWVGVGNGAALSSGPVAVYAYTNCFWLPCTAAAIVGQYAADNSAQIWLNGVQTPNNTSLGWGFNNWKPVSITSGFQVGLNTLVFYVNNDGGGDTGLRTELIGKYCPVGPCPPCLTVTCPPNACYPQTGPGTVVNYPPPNVTTPCNTTIAGVACVPPSGSSFPPGPTTVTCTAQDQLGNTASCSFTVTVSPNCCEQQFSDSTFNNSDWTLTLLPCGGGGSSSAGQIATSGCDGGAFRRIVNNLNPSGGLIGIHLRNGATHNPATQGALSTVDYSECNILFSDGGDGQATGPALKQNGKYYILNFAQQGITPQATWATFSLIGLGATAFDLVDCSKPGFADSTQHPDFCGGSLIEFGFFRGNSTSGANTLIGGIDNWWVRLHCGDCASCPTNNLIVNGSFELGVFSDTDGNPDNCEQFCPSPCPTTSTGTLPGWTVITDEIARCNNANSYCVTASAGTNCLDLAGKTDSPPHGGVTQTVQTTIGQCYRLSFDVGVLRSPTSCGPISVRVTAGAITQTFTHNPEVGTCTVWRTFSLLFLGTGATPITFEGVSGTCFIGLDNIELVCSCDCTNCIVCPPVNQTVTGCPPVVPDYTTLNYCAPPNGPHIVTQTPPPGTPLVPTGPTVVTIRITDAAGNNRRDCDVTLTPVCTPGCTDGFPPLVLTCPANQTHFTCGAPVVVNYTPTVVGGAPPVNVTCSPPSSTAFPIGTHVVTCTATDRCTATTCTFTVKVQAAPPKNCYHLAVVLARTNIVISWPVEATNFELEAAASLSPPVIWLPIDAVVQEADGHRSVTLPIDRPTRFFRLSSAPTTACDWSKCDTNSPLAGRFEHTAVWTGSEMIIWGGYNGVTLFNDGARYNPTTGLWTPMSTVNAPVARYRHPAVWTGTELIIWGGSGAAPFLNSGARYNPATDTWTALPTAGAPVGRDGHAAVWTGTEMVIWGGRASGNVYQNTGGRYNPGNNTWTATSTAGAPAGRNAHGMVWASATGEVVVWGGAAGATTFGDGARYNPVANTWTPIAAAGAPSARSHFPSVWSGAEMIIWSGAGTAGILNTGARYHPATDIWTTMTTVGAPAPIARFQFAAVWTGSQMIAFGGWNGGASYNDGGCYDPVANTWTALPTTGVPPPRYSHTMAWDGNEALIWGGRSTSSATSTVAPDVWCFRKCP